MGREVKRISLEFDWYERKGHDTWKGYLLDEITCPLCEGSELSHDGVKRCVLCYGAGKVCPKVEPEHGEGYQVWQDVSEGGPVSPVFLKPIDLAHWMVENDDSVTRDTTFLQWLKFIKEESCAPSMIMSGGSVGSGVAKLTKEE